MSVLDFCSGKGGDLMKYFKMNTVSYYTGVDITLESHVEAIRRYNNKLLQCEQNNENTIQADFVLADVCSVPLFKHFPHRFDIVSCMFALHYAFFSRDSAELFFSNVRHLMAANGCFIAVFPCKEVIEKRLQQ